MSNKKPATKKSGSGDDDMKRLQKRYRARRFSQGSSETDREVTLFGYPVFSIGYIGIAVVVAIIAAAIITSLREPPPPPPIDRTLPKDPALKARVLGTEARVPLSCKEVTPAWYADIAHLAEGSESARTYQELSVESHSYPLEINNSIGMRLRLVPAGSFIMGSPETEAQRGPDEVPHQVTIANPFYMGKFEVTQEQWMKVMADKGNPSFYKRNGKQKPVEEVSWFDGEAFARRLCEKEGVPIGTYRLPSEEEWEYACRAGSQTAYCFGDNPKNLKAYSKAERNSKGTAVVGSYRPNAYGIYDMHGNVWEWCRDQFYSYEDPTIKEHPVKNSIRGGNWYVEARDCRSASRFRHPPGSKGNYCGFRIVRSIEPLTPKITIEPTAPKKNDDP